MAVSRTEQELRELKVNFLRAAQAKDRNTLNALIHDDFSLVDPSGNEVGKRELINDIVHDRSDFLHNFNRHDHSVAFHIDGNVARETAAVRMRGNHARHGDITGEYINSATYLRTTDGWKMIGNTLHRATGPAHEGGHERRLSGVGGRAAQVPGWGVSIVEGELRVEGEQQT